MPNPYVVRCPKCAVIFMPNSEVYKPLRWEQQFNDNYGIEICCCPNCDQMTIFLTIGVFITKEEEPQVEMVEIFSRQMLYPNTTMKEVPPEVPRSYADEFQEAWSVITISPKASAALSRRLLERILAEVYGHNQTTLSSQIEAFLKGNDIPANLKGDVDAIRNIGNFAAHPIKDSQTGTIIEVEPQEADWLIAVLESLFEVAFVQPARAQKRRDELNQKLDKAGRPLLKSS